MIKLVKVLATVEDLELGLGTVTQQRDIGAGVPEDIILTQLNASEIPSNGPSTIQTDIDARYTKIDIDADFATIAQVLTKTQLDVYTPTGLYHPATKKYVDDTVVAIGAGDMATATYDVLSTGVVDDAELLGGVSPDLVMQYRGVSTDLDTATELGTYTGTDVTNSPITGEITVLNLENGVGVHIQRLYAATATYSRVHTGVSWTDWVRRLTDQDIQNNLLGTVETDIALGAHQGKILQDNIDTATQSISNNTSAISVLDINKIEDTDYATATVGGTVKALLSGTTLYLTIDGSDAGA